MIAAVLGLLASIHHIASYGGIAGRDILLLLSTVSVPGFHLVLAIFGWVFAASLSRKIVGQTDPNLELSGVTIEHLYALVILGFGLYFCLDHLSPAIFQLSEAMVKSRTGPSLLEGPEPVSKSELLSHLAPCGIGLVLALFSSKLGKKLATLSP
jgi:hypothetical protein